ncbi:multidrug effflux MFS transporter [Neobacillus sp. SuZ13]|uniref:multidrug effflux MFS transporter n=1 Tax=Neobacillus sp. SuZ13 TaxID=3047875 RepID=UPI0024BF2CB4|nr:multidrug effflux MFS transporter [Neobacillus sp. SuZ13]WHY69073.1 multidrug effflux MFS transporter [Neobacillus sp. SuZ13]
MNDSFGDIESTKSSSLRSKRVGLAMILGTLAAFGPLSIDMYLPALPHIAKELHTTTSLVQLSLTFFLLGLSLGQLVSGPLSDVRGRRKPLLFGLMIYMIASLLCAFSQSIWFLIILRFIQGFAGAAGIVIARAIVRDLYSGSELTKFFSLIALVNGVAPILAPIVGGQLLRIAPWQGIFLVLSLIGLSMFFIVLFGLPETLPTESRSQGGIYHTMTTFKNLLFDRSFIGYALSQGLIFAAMFAYISGSPFVLQNVYGASPQFFSLIFAINGIGIIISSQITGRLAGQVSEKKLFVVGISIAFAGSIMLLILILLHAGLYLILLPLFFVVSSVGMVSTSGSSIAMQNQGRSAGSAAALLGVLSFVFGGSTAPLTGLGNVPALSMGIVMAIVSFGAVLIYIFLKPRHEEKSKRSSLTS